MQKVKLYTLVTLEMAVKLKEEMAEENKKESEKLKIDKFLDFS